MSDEQVLTFAELFPSLIQDPVFALVFDGKSVFEPWFPRHKETGEPEEEGVRAIFRGWWLHFFAMELLRKPGADSRPAPIFPRISRTKPRENKHEHPNLKGIGGDRLYGGRDRDIGTHAFLNGPFWFGDRVTIHEPAQIVGPCLIGHKTRIGSSSIIKRSIVGAESRVDGHSHLNDAIVGSNVFIAPGVVLENTDDPFDEDGFVTIPDYRETVAPGTSRTFPWRRRGSLIGDHCRIKTYAILEAGVVLFPGCIVPRRATVTPGIYDPAAIRRMYPSK